MAHLDSMFVFEIILKELKTFGNSKQFAVRSQFADIFAINLKDPADNVANVPKRRKTLRGRAKHVKEGPIRCEGKQTAESQSIVFTSNVDRLMSYMMQYPMVITLCSKDDPGERIVSTHIPWNPAFVQFLARLYQAEEPPPVVVEDLHNVFDEYTSRRMASIKLNIKLSHIKGKNATHFRGRSQEKPNTSMLAEANPTPTCDAMTTTVKKPIAAAAGEGTGIIKTIYRGRKSKKRNPNKRNIKKNNNVKNCAQKFDKHEVPKKESLTITNTLNTNNQVDKNILSFVKSEADITQKEEVNISKSKSCSSLKNLNTLHYIFGDQRGMFGNRIYTVGYFTVTNPTPPSARSSQEKMSNKSSDKSQTSSKTVSPTASKQQPLAKTSTVKSPDHAPSPKQRLSESMLQSNIKYKFELCTNQCPSKHTRLSLSEFSLDLPQEDANLITVTKCKEQSCQFKKDRDPLEPPDHRVLIKMSSRENPCCVTEATKVEERVVGSMEACMTIDPCYCACECVFDVHKTTYCKICGGFEIPGDDTTGKPPYLMPIPCPEYHHLTDKNKAKTGSTSGSESKKKHGKGEIDDSKKGKKQKRKDDRFKFNYGYKGIPPQIGHSQCGMPCTGNLNNVPKSMGWLWTSDNVPGMKFRPQWKPGAVSKFVLRLLRMAKNPGEVSKKRKKDTGKKKRPLKRPLLVVHKKDGEYTVTMETMKAYTKPRALNQQPYEDKPVITYTIGRTEEENRERRKKKERAQRRLQREQRAFIQSAFRDMCQEICLKTYQQALQILPDAEDPKCSCYPALPGPERVDMERSCSCSEDSEYLASDTDSDEWIVEFTPPNAHFDPTYKGKKIIKTDNATQYTYLDYRVKLLDRFGNPVPRFFKGIDGKQLCSDLGGFWNADHQWQEINVDGIVGPDARWAPMAFSGPNGEQVDIDTTGKFQAMNGEWLVVGVDGYIDSHCKWRFYPKPKQVPVKKKRTPVVKKGAGDRNAKKTASPEISEPAWSCFGDASPIELGKMGIVGHGADKKLLQKTLQHLVARGEKDVQIPHVSRVPRSPARARGRAGPKQYDSRTHFEERRKCHHPAPSEKGIVTDARGHRKYFKSNIWKNRRPKERIHYLDSQGRSVSTFHEPCFHSFTDCETMKQQQRERLMRLAGLSEGSPTNQKTSTRGPGQRSYRYQQAGNLTQMSYV